MRVCENHAIVSVLSEKYIIPQISSSKLLIAPLTTDGHTPQRFSEESLHQKQAPPQPHPILIRSSGVGLRLGHVKHFPGGSEASWSTSPTHPTSASPHTPEYAGSTVLGSNLTQLLPSGVPIGGSLASVSSRALDGLASIRSSLHL